MGEQDLRSRPPGRVRIVAGSKRGHRLKVPPGNVRPTSEMVREAIFNVLGPIVGLRVLDLFAGTGAMGLEALSRGAAQCVFVEADPKVVSVLRENIAFLGYQDSSEVIAQSYTAALTALVERGSKFDLLFVDPPYRMLPKVENALMSVAPSLVSPGGLVVIESSRSARPDLGGVRVFERVYGSTRVTMVGLGRNDV